MLAALRRLAGHGSDFRKVARIARANDAFRRQPYASPANRVLFTPGVMALADAGGSALGLAAAMFAQAQILLLIAEAFDEREHGRGERDTGAVYYRGNSLVFRITYHAADFMGPARDPSNPGRTARIMTIALAGEPVRGL